MAVGDPIGEDLCVGTTDGDTLPEWGDTPGWEEREITFGSPIELTLGTKYAIVVNAASSVGDAELFWSHRIDNPTADGDSYDSSDSGGSWAISTDDDSWFKTKASAVEKDDGSFTADGFDRAESAYKTTWEAQTFTAGSTYTISSVVLKLAKYTVWGGTVEIATISIRATDTGLPGKPTNPSPADTETGITLHNTTGTWESGGSTDSYNIYYGTLSGFLVLVEEGVTDLSLVLVDGNFSVYGKISYWRVDAVNTNGTTVGDEWYFTTMNFGPPLPTGVTLDHSGGGGGVPTGTATGLNNMITIKKLIVAANNKIWCEDV